MWHLLKVASGVGCSASPPLRPFDETIDVVDKKLGRDRMHRNINRKGSHLEAIGHKFERTLFFGSLLRESENGNGLVPSYAKLDTK